MKTAKKESAISLPAGELSWWHGCLYQRRFWAVVFLFLTLAAYAPALKGPFFFDDEHFIVRNDQVHNLENISAIYTSNTTAGALIDGNFYRPNQQLVYALLYRCFGVETPVPYHLTSLLLHSLAAFLLLTLLMLLGFAVPAAAAGTLLFLLHPVQSESVAYISGMSDPIAIVFILSGLICYTRAIFLRLRLAKGWLALSVLCFVLALLSRENAIVFAPIVCVLTLFFRRVKPRPPRGQQMGVVALFCAMAAGYFVLKLTALNFQHAFGLTDKVNAYTSDIFVRLITFVNVLWDYMVLIFYPMDLFYEKPYRAYLTLSEWRGLFGLFVLAFFALTALFARRWPRFALGAAVAACGLLPFCGAVPLNAMFLEHWLYIPMVGVAIMGATLLQNFGQTSLRPLLGSALALVLALMFVRTNLRAAEWGDVEHFYLNEVAHGGASLRILNNLAMYYADHQELGKAEDYYKQAIAGGDGGGMPQPHHNLARVYLSKGRLNEAVDELRKALAIDHRFIYSLNLLSEIFQASGDERRATALRAAAQQVYEGKNYDYVGLDAALFGS